MELEIIKQKDMPLLGRKRVSLWAHFENLPTPSASSIRAGLAKKLKVKEKLVAIRHVYQHFGGGRAKVIAHIYNKFEDLKSLEKKKVVMVEAKPEEKKESPKEEAPKEETPKGEAPKEETPKGEASKEEVPKEEEKKNGKEESKE